MRWRGMKGGVGMNMCNTCNKLPSSEAGGCKVPCSSPIPYPLDAMEAMYHGIA